MRIAFILMVASLVMSTPAPAEMLEVKTLNRNESGPMVHEPDFLEMAPGER